MAEQDVGIRFVGRDDASRVANNVKSSLDGITQSSVKANSAIGSAFGTLRGQLTGLTSALSAAGIVGAAVGLGKLAVNLANVGEESAQLEARFNAFSGGAANGAANIRLMNDAIGVALTRDNQMIAMNALMASGLTETAAQAANVAQAAVWLGDATLAPIQRIDALTNALISGRTRGLVPYGVDIDKLKARVSELQAANSGLSDSQATLNAFMEQAGPLMQKVQEEGGVAVTSIQELTKAWEDMIDGLGDVVSPNVSPLISDLAGVVRLLNDIQRGSSSDTGQRREGLEGQRRAAENLLAQYNESIASGGAPPWAAAMRNAAIKAISEINAELAGLPAGFDAAGNNSGAAFASGISSGMRGVPDMFSDIGGAAVQNFNAQISRLTGSVFLPTVKTNLTLASPGFFANEEDNTFRNELQKLQADNARELTQYQIQLSKAQTDTTTKAWTSAASDVAKAWKDGIGDVKGELTKGMGVSKGLADYTGTGGGGANDPNGWMKDIRRLQAWISDGSWGETAAKFGITDKGDAKERIRKFQTGQWDESVTALIDKDALKKQIQSQGAGAAFLDAFAADVAQASGENPAVVKAMLGFQGDKNGKGALDMKPMAQAVTTGFSAELSTQSAEFIKSGNTLFSYVGQGFIDSAKSSGLLLQAVQAMVYSLLPKQ